MKKRKGMILSIVNYCLTLLGIISILINLLFKLCAQYGLIRNLDETFYLIIIIFLLGIYSTGFMYMVASIVISIINLIKGKKIFKIISIINIVLNIVLLHLLQFVINAF